MTNPSESGGAETFFRPAHEAIMLGTDLKAWHKRTEILMESGAQIIALRGAGTVNGIEPSAAHESVGILEGYLDYMLRKGGQVVLIYDGDQDNRQMPDIGATFGMLADKYKSNPKVALLVAQTKSWYYPNQDDGPLTSQNGTPYETFVFDDQVEGGHCALTQSDMLVSYSGYEQAYVGPVGPIAFDQLQDLSQKAARRPSGVKPVNVTIISTPNNPAVGLELAAQFEKAADVDQKIKIGAKLAQRVGYPYGAFFDPAGEFCLDASQYPGLSLHVVTAAMSK